VTSAPSTGDVVVAYLRALSNGDVESAVALVAEDFHNEHTSALGNSLRGRAAYRQRLPQFLTQFQDLRYDLEDLILDGERAAAPYTMTFRWVADDGREVPVSIRGVFRFRVVDGHITHRVDYWDGADFQRQIAASQGA
jgi:steroid delta-isomerase-like uncharacterized protein